MPIFFKEDRAILFVHIPKTGGTSIERKFMESGFQLAHIDRGVDFNRHRICSPQHMDAGQYPLILDLESFSFRFAVVREPLSRLKSELAMRLAQGFRNDVDENDEWVLDGLRRYENDSYVFDNHLKPQSDFIVDGVCVYRFEDGIESILAAITRELPWVSLTPGVLHAMSRQKKSGFASEDVRLSGPVIDEIKGFYRRDYEAYYPRLL